MGLNGVSLSSLVMARRLLLYSQQYRQRLEKPGVETQSALEAFQEDQAIIQGRDKTQIETKGKQKDQETRTTEVRLSDLVSWFKELRKHASQTDTVVSAEIKTSTVVETSMKFEVSSLPRVDGLVLRNEQLAETDRYRFEFVSADVLTIVDKWSGLSTRIWGDPHIDVSDEEGDFNGDFKDLKGSDSHTTFILLDQTRVTITAKDDGIIEAVDLFKGSQHIRGYGGASQQWQSGQTYFQPASSSASFSSVPLGDVVHAGGDGNDWFDASGKLLWGKTTASAVLSRPYAVARFSLQQRVEQVVEAGLEIKTSA